ncbi:MAG: 5-formyltetrahydrofolate cyclo-ligase [Candidatus Thioglobus sp.]|jgi:5,10-methenyltetrahydrofolate synthetase
MPIMKNLRQSLRQQRCAIKSSNREKFAKKLLHQTQKIANFQNGQKIAIYLPNDGEIDTKYIQNFLKNRGFSVYLPILVGKSLKFAKVGKNFRKNRFGIDEPIFTQILNANQLNIVFMPLVGFDKFKNRIGMGGGFYDRTLVFKNRQQNYKNPKLYGLAFDCQEVAKLNINPWDIPLDAVVTPTTIYR